MFARANGEPCSPTAASWRCPASARFAAPTTCACACLLPTNGRREVCDDCAWRLLCGYPLLEPLHTSAARFVARPSTLEHRTCTMGHRWDVCRAVAPPAAGAGRAGGGNRGSRESRRARPISGRGRTTGPTLTSVAKLRDGREARPRDAAAAARCIFGRVGHDGGTIDTQEGAARPSDHGMSCYGMSDESGSPTYGGQCSQALVASLYSPARCCSMHGAGAATSINVHRHSALFRTPSCAARGATTASATTVSRSRSAGTRAHWRRQRRSHRSRRPRRRLRCKASCIAVRVKLVLGVHARVVQVVRDAHGKADGGHGDCGPRHGGGDRPAWRGGACRRCQLRWAVCTLRWSASV